MANSESSRDEFVTLAKLYLHDDETVCSLQSRDELRLKVSEEADQIVKSFLSGPLSLEDFKLKVDSLNRRNRLWGFGGNIGQMFFNMLYNASADRRSLSEALTRWIALPSDIEEAGSKISSMQNYVIVLRESLDNKKKRPQVKPVAYFLSYFWQIQDRSWPILYPSIEEALSRLGMLVFNEDYGEYYKDFYRINSDLMQVLSELMGRKASVYDVEHALWWYVQTYKPPPEPPPPPVEDVDMNYIPPIVADIPALARSDPKTLQRYQQEGKIPEQVLETRLAVLFKMIGWDVEQLGHTAAGKRMPDGILTSQFPYAVIYDAKESEGGYSIAGDDIRIIQYIKNYQREAKRQRIQRLYFMIISSDFKGRYDESISKIMHETEAKNVVLAKAYLLLKLLELRLRKPQVTLEDLETLFKSETGRSHVFEKETIEEIFGEV
jgi:hypothetical protein